MCRTAAEKLLKARTEKDSKNADMFMIFHEHISVYHCC